MKFCNAVVMATRTTAFGVFGLLLAMIATATACGSGSDDLSDARRAGQIDATALPVDANVDGQINVPPDARGDAAVTAPEAHVDARVIVPPPPDATAGCQRRCQRRCQSET